MIYKNETIQVELEEDERRIVVESEADASSSSIMAKTKALDEQDGRVTIIIAALLSFVGLIALGFTVRYCFMKKAIDNADLEKRRVNFGVQPEVDPQDYAEVAR